MKNVFVGNLSSGTTAATIRSLFQEYGAVAHVKLKTDHQTGLSRGFAFVEMIAVEADRAIAALNGRLLDGQELTVREGRPKLRSVPAGTERQLPRQ